METKLPIGRFHFPRQKCTVPVYTVEDFRVLFRYVVGKNIYYMWEELALRRTLDRISENVIAS